MFKFDTREFTSVYICATFSPCEKERMKKWSESLVIVSPVGGLICVSHRERERQSHTRIMHIYRKLSRRGTIYNFTSVKPTRIEASAWLCVRVCMCAALQYLCYIPIHDLRERRNVRASFRMLQCAYNERAFCASAIISPQIYYIIIIKRYAKKCL